MKNVKHVTINEVDSKRVREIKDDEKKTSSRNELIEQGFFHPSRLSDKEKTQLSVSFSTGLDRNEINSVNEQLAAMKISR